MIQLIFIYCLWCRRKAKWWQNVTSLFSLCTFKVVHNEQFPSSFKKMSREQVVDSVVTVMLTLTFTAVRPLSTDEVIGYLGETATLPSRADPSWNLTSIEWSILPNTTWIATCRGTTTILDRFYRYEGRLSLNSTSGERKSIICQGLHMYHLFNRLFPSRWLDDPWFDGGGRHGIHRDSPRPKATGQQGPAHD